MGDAGAKLYLVRTFGHSAVTDGCGTDLTPHGRKARALLAYCIVSGSTRIPRERLAALLWGDRGDAQARASLRQTLYELRQFTQGHAPLLKTDREQVCIDPTRMVTESTLIEAAFTAGEAAEAAKLIGDRPAELLDDLSGISAEFDQWLSAERAHWRERRRQIALGLAKQAHATGDFATARRLALAPLVADPLDELAAVTAMDAMRALGDRDEGHRVFVQLEQSLREELGVAPSAEAVASHAQLLNGCPGPARDPSAGEQPARTVLPPARSASGWPWRPAIVTAAAIAALAALSTVSTFRDEPPPRLVTAVLPFEHPGGDPQAKMLAATTASSISDALAQMGRSVTVPSVTAQLRGSDAQTAAQKLQIPYLVRGEVWRDGGTIRVAVRLDDIHHGVTLLSQTFESLVEAAHSLPDQIAASAGAAIATTDLLNRIDAKGAADPQVAARFLRQIVAIHEGNSMLAYDEAKKLFAETPDSPLSQMALAMTTGFFLPEIAPADRLAALTKARAAARQVRLQAPTFGDGYIPECLLSPRLWRRACEARLRYALAVDAHAPSVDGFLSTLLVEAGRTREAAAWARSSLEVRPFNAHRAAWYLYFAETLGDDTEVAWVTHRTDRYWPNRPQIAESAFLGRIARGAWGESRDLLRHRPNGFIYLQPEQLGELEGVVASLAGKHPDVSAVRRLCATREPPPLTIAGACLAGFAHLGDLDRAFALADVYYPDLRGRSPQEEMAKWLRHGPPPYETSILFAPVTRSMRADPRFTALADRLRLRDYWRSNGWPDFCAVERVAVCNS